MPQGRIEIIPLEPGHLDAAAALSRQAGWPHRREDWELVLALGKGFAAVEDERLVGTAMATLYGESCATVNMVIVDAAMRGRGLGRLLMNAALDAAGARECRLVATAEGLPLYEKLGFVATGEILQHQGTVLPVEAPRTIEWAGPEAAAELAGLDAAAFGARRDALFEALARQGRFAVIRQNGAIAGFAALRAFGRGEVVGPVVAPDAETAKALLSFVFAARTGAFLRVDTTAETGLAAWLAARGLTHAGGGVPMRRNAPRAAHAAASLTTFALASQALG